ncbi:MAG: BRCT domain-containing protein [Deltaproteobacteria bacterium]|nr:BRCT domain-containing protein [Deltaproteobacteria bacterium]
MAEDEQLYARRAATETRLLKRSCESLLGICAGLLADGVLSDDEIHFLSVWLDENENIATTWPGEVVYARVKDVLADGVVTEDERDYLKQSLSELLGAPFQETGATSGVSVRLPVDDVETIIVPGRSFCFTGNFLYGTRKACERAVTERGGDPRPRVTLDLNYLVIGAMTTHEWAHTSYGRKIEKAVAYREKGRPIQIVNEEQWVQFL